MAGLIFMFGRQRGFFFSGTAGVVAAVELPPLGLSRGEFVSSSASAELPPSSPLVSSSFASCLGGARSLVLSPAVVLEPYHISKAFMNSQRP